MTNLLRCDNPVEAFISIYYVTGAGSSLSAFPCFADAGESKGAVELVVGKMNHPLHTSLHITAGFQALSDSSTLPKTLSLGVHLYNLLPVSLPCQHLQVSHFCKSDVVYDLCDPSANLSMTTWVTC